MAPGFSVDAMHQGNLLRFVNDADPLNLVTKKDQGGNILYYAIRDIYPGEELFVDYGPNYWKFRNRL